MVKARHGEDEIKFTVGEAVNGDIFHFIDTDDPTVDQDAITNWFKKVQKPKEVGMLNELRTQEVSEEKETKSKSK